MNNEKLNVIEELESSVRSYVRSFPTVFTKARGHKMWDENGKEYIDFFSGAGALNYGHNEPNMKKRLVEYILDDGITHSLDMASDAKVEFLEKFNDVILKPREMNYKVMFPGPTGTNSVESALKIARKATGRTDVISFTNGFHGMTIGSLSVTGNSMKRQGAGIPLQYSPTMPYDDFVGSEDDTLDYLERFLEDNGSGVSIPAAMIFETVQGEGGINAARFEWMKKLSDICERWGILLIVDDVQAGVGRTGTFFSFEPAGIKPDIVCLSKSIGGYGSPFALTLIDPKLDELWVPGEHNGTFRGNNHAFVTAAESLKYWEDPKFEKSIQTKSELITKRLEKLIQDYPAMKGHLKGRGFMQGVSSDVDGFSEKVAEKAFCHGLIMETAGGHDEVFKLFPPINIDEEGLTAGLDLIEKAVQSAITAMELDKTPVGQ
ncbi:diaminobutyrate--2-oxoglutarate transaminase [Salisediminibacterium halotolerans]|uniref:Diaminobutyrate--2-oxoglutarate transaminase n=1 Tax=Salisediminibacterium halotolerans TaxID=517425 RepID=A0A1H9RQU4_9BACI|nr:MULTISPECIES: diaminobutyrate--2-oxoglutarate transaminase [Salisediminibacterium]RLJ81043.1 diaminobutyrate aminotransferase [Actinophytocola xinjiangensis]RPE87867.1 diaminobutyrate aminotransferase [Salisediminibacterium halotolerans]TWG37936.1 diaminobutyrate aminotransferase [Salisediminibacterium halotolerans]SER74898.1 diaminobutyrate-2-oxoglutarate transaminase [Salisediminibacterium haloalkalitolerans]GEL08819.1 diaminobutyrate--2-oxoglutarate transaminase [Salisediminibacterium ha